jgi:hypothetical protein
LKFESSSTTYVLHLTCLLSRNYGEYIYTQFIYSNRNCYIHIAIRVDELGINSTYTQFIYSNRDVYRGRTIKLVGWGPIKNFFNNR